MSMEMVERHDQLEAMARDALPQTWPDVALDTAKELILNISFAALLRGSRFIRLNRLCEINDMGRTTMERLLKEHHVQIRYIGNVPYVAVCEWERAFKEMAK